MATEKTAVDSTPVCPNCGEPRIRNKYRKLLKSCGCGKCIRAMSGAQPGSTNANAGVYRG